MNEPVLTEDAVNAIMRYAMYTGAEVEAAGGKPADAVLAQGAVRHMGFHPQRIAEKSEEIGKLLAELPEPFQRGRGGGWSFLNACLDREDRQWGEHMTIDVLLCLGIATGRVTYLLPRDKWGMFPGGMPYFETHDPETPHPLGMPVFLDPGNE